ncbi:bifunctional DNA-formamidopyrimidine glycosylase/DNA-(apurinic or apyrimidinic site) lyase [Patescibacteria group bacterium]
MPELPEVTTIKNDLVKEILGKQISNISTFNSYPLKPNKYIFERHAVNHSVVDIENVGKLICVYLSSNYCLAIHLGMSGNLLYNTKDKYVKIKITFEDKSALYYSTIRKFGYFELWTSKILHTYRQKVGRNVLDPKLELHEFITAVKRSKGHIKNVLLNQRLISGVGNIYANDALFLSKIHPKTSTSELDDEEFQTLFNNLKFVLSEGIKNRGSSIDRYRDLYGNKGKHQKHFKVYGKKGQLCTRCGITKLSYDKMQGRGTYYCKSCQISK